MNRKSMKNYQPTKRRFIQFIGSPLDDVSAIQSRKLGANAHRSSTDKDDTQEVISVSLLTKSGISVCAIHLHLDGTWKLFTRGRGIKARHAAKIESANLPGHISTKDTPYGCLDV
ncbi:hypothetical protein N7516_000442 [Penicillium verrucosum]|uniref:uncharacterized protein n=1 Tax=Penicillium verrucosum TaxID=60171 RepID=UPI002545A344|nr:uncharacterized protein N7516_000442 [Penicillium verrucosum]KAJ5940274.1 hypothetical protein N7516_000442 [Penicillium verrucosum]